MQIETARDDEHMCGVEERKDIEININMNFLKTWLIFTEEVQNPFHSLQCMHHNVDP